MFSPSRGQDIGIDPRLKTITLRNQWGSRAIPNGLISLGDNEFLYAGGCRAVRYSIDDGKSGVKTVLPHYNEVTSILSMHISGCKTYVALSVRCKHSGNKAVGLIYEVKGDPTARPKQIVHEVEDTAPKIKTERRRGANGLLGRKLCFIGMAFSANARLLACHCNHIESGILIYDWALQKLSNTIETKTMLCYVSFNPMNDTKLCAVGHQSTFQFWHYGPRSAHVAPIDGLPAGNSEFTYFTHVWIAPDCVIAACSSGDICLVQGCSMRQRVAAFDQETDSGELVFAKPSFFLFRKQKLFCFSEQNFVSIFDVDQQEISAGQFNWSLVLKNRCRLAGIEDIVGVSWADLSDNNLTAAVLTGGGLFSYNFSNAHKLTYPEGDDDNSSVDSVERKPGLLLDEGTALSSLTTAKSIRKNKYGGGSSVSSKKKSVQADFRWGYLRAEKVIMRGHHGDVVALSISKRTSIMISASNTDKTVRTWDFNMTNQSDIMVDDFSDRTTDIPNTVDMHPSGLHAFVGCEDFAIEYAVTESRLEITKKIPVKIALVCPSGEPFVNSSPVTLVKYAHGGQHVAIVTGRLVQIFHLYNLDFSTDKAGTPTRVMALTEHNAAITDIAFSKDDQKIYTTSQDGALFEWTFGKVSRDSDFIVKSVPAMHVAVSPLMTSVVAYFESPDEAQDKAKRNTLTKRGSVSNILNQPAFQSAQSFSANVNKARATIASTGGASAQSATFDGTAAPVSQKKMFLAYFEGGRVAPNNGKVLPVDVSVTSIAFGIADPSKQDPSKPGEMFIMGLADGRILISMLPLPLRVMEDTSLLRIVARSTTTNMGGMEISSGEISAAADVVTNSEDMDAYTKDKDASTKDAALTNLDIAPEHEDHQVSLYGLDEAKCRSMAVHDGAVVSIKMPPSGNWILTAGFDGCMFMLATTVRARTMENAHEALGGDNTVFLTERSALLTNKDTLENMRQFVAEAELEKNRSIADMESNMKKHSDHLTAHLQSELERRDSIIVKGREEQTRICRIMQEEIDENKAVHEKAMQELEVYYEKRLAQNQQYLQSMMQAYDEQLVHARKDLEELQAEAERSKKIAAEERLGVVSETDKQKAVMLQYCDYIAERNKEVFVELEETHDTEKAKLRNDLIVKSDQIDALKQKNRTDLAVVNRTVMLQREEISEKDMRILTQKQEIDTLLAKLGRQDKSLTEATAEILRRTEIAERWEYKAGVQQQQLLEIEKVRKALTTQLHSLREKIGPQWELLVRTEDRLKEVDTEYGQSLIDLSEKEAKLAHAGSIVQLMQKQLRELRAKLTRKDHSLNRAVKILTEFELRMEEAKFENGRKITVKKTDSNMVETYAVVSEAMSPGIEGKGKPKGKDVNTKWQPGLKVMDVFSSTPEMEASLKRLKDILVTASGAVGADATASAEDTFSEEQQLVQEQRRQMALLQKNIVGLKSNLKLSSSVSATKIHHFLHDNDYLLEQVNSLRQQVRNLTNENRMLLAREVFVEAKKVSNSVSFEKDDDFSQASLDLVPPPVSKKEKQSSKKKDKSRTSIEDSLASVSIPIPSQALSMISNSEFPVPPFEAAAPSIDLEKSIDDGMVGSLGISRDDIIAQTLSEGSSVDRSLHVVIKGGGNSKRQAAADRKIAEILSSNQKLIAELNLENSRHASVQEAFSEDVYSAPNTPDLNMSRQTTAEGGFSRSGRVNPKEKQHRSPGPGNKISSTVLGKNYKQLKFGGLRERQGITKQGQIYAPSKTAVELKKSSESHQLRSSASINSIQLLPPVSSISMKKQPF